VRNIPISDFLHYFIIELEAHTVWQSLTYCARKMHIFVSCVSYLLRRQQWIYIIIVKCLNVCFIHSRTLSGWSHIRPTNYRYLYFASRAATNTIKTV